MENYSSFWSKTPSFGDKFPVIGFTDATDPRVLIAVREIIDKKLGKPLLIGEPEQIISACKNAHLSLPDSEFITHAPTPEELSKYTNILVEKQKKNGVNEDAVSKQLNDSLYRGVAMLLDGQIQGLVGGSLRPTADIVRAAIQCIGPRENERLVSGHFLIESTERMTSDKTPFLFADCAVVPEPSARSLAAIGLGAAASYKFFTGCEPRVALLSFSTRGSATHELVDRIKEALELIRKQNPNLVVDGELQVDAALDPEVALIKKANDSQVSGKANVFVFPTLEAGNIGYKLVQRFSKARIAGPLLWGLKRPMSDLSRGCSVQEIVDTTQCVSHMIGGLN